MEGRRFKFLQFEEHFQKLRFHMGTVWTLNLDVG